jgi:outer membrane protein TolC
MPIRALDTPSSSARPASRPAGGAQRPDNRTRLAAGTWFALIALLILALLTSGCTPLGEFIRNGFKVGPDYQRPPVPLAKDWIDANDVRVRKGDDNLSHWWTVFQDPVLDSLICYAYQQNLTLREAACRVLEARAQLAIAVGNIFPQSQEMTGDYTRNAVSIETASSQSQVTASRKRWFQQFDCGFNMSWELDFWGRLRRAIESDQATLDASVEDYDDVLVTLLGDIATNYVQYRTFELRIEYANQNVDLQRETLKIVENSVKAGLQPEIDLVQARATLDQTLAVIPELEIGLRQIGNQLCILLGVPPEDLQLRLGSVVRPLRLADASFEELRQSKAVPEPVLAKLVKLKDQPFPTRDALLKALSGALDEDERTRFQAPLLDAVRYSPRYRLTASALAAMRANKDEAPAAAKLAPLQDQVFDTREKFSAALDKALGKDAFTALKNRLLLTQFDAQTIPVAPPQVASGVPADLVRRRPDVRRAERQAAAQSAQIGVADADFYPRIALNASFGWSAQHLSNLFKEQGFNGTFGPAFRWEILNYGRILNNVRFQDARFQELVAAYQNTVLTAARDVENGLVMFLRAHQRTRFQTASVANAQAAVNISLAQYQAGTTDLTRVTLLQQNLVQQQDTLAQAQGEIAAGLIMVYRGLGGGWELRLEGCKPGPLPPPETGPAPGPSTPPEALPQPRRIGQRVRPSGAPERLPPSVDRHFQQAPNAAPMETVGPPIAVGRPASSDR